jgi:energy-coupling factor transporter ATP-binding protein EcfA2
MHDDGTFATAPLSFALKPGERVILRGSSGAGKSTLLAALAGVAGQLGQQSGELLVNGRNPQDARGQIGLVLQDPYSQAVMERIGDDVAFGLENIGVPPGEMNARIGDALAGVGLHLLFDHPTDALSGGERQRLALAGVLALRPTLLLLDEPTANLDPKGALLICDSVAHMAREHNMTLIVVDHNPELWQGIVTRELLLDERGITESPLTVTATSGQAPGHARTPNAPKSTEAKPTEAKPTPLLWARSLAVGYPNARAAQVDLDIDVAAGEILAVTGANGVGKSALALTLGGLIPPMAGEVSVAAPAPNGPPHKWSSRELARHIGSVFQAPEHQFIGSTVRKDVGFGLRNRSHRAQLSAQVDATLTEFNLAAQHEQNPFTLSGGEKRRLSIADAVVLRPRILIFDEPTFGQDDVTRHDLVTSFRRLRDAGHAIVVVTHDERFVTEVADSQLVLMA